MAAGLLGLRLMRFYTLHRALESLSLIAGPTFANIHVPLAFDADLLLADLAGDALGILHGALAHRDLFLNDGLLLHADLLLADRDADLLAGPDVRRGGRFTRGGVPLDDDLLPLHRHLHRPVLGDHLLADPGRARFHRLLAGLKLFLADLDRLVALGRAGGAGGRGRGGPRGPRRRRLHVVRPVTAEDRHRLLVTPIRLDRHDGPARLELALIVAGLLFGEARSRQGPDQAADRRPARRIRQDRGERPARDHRPDDGDDAGEDAEAHEAAQARPGQGTGDGPGPRARALFGGRRPQRLALGPACGDPDLVLPEPGLAEFVDGRIRLAAVFEDADCRGTLLGCPGHGCLPMLVLCPKSMCSACTFRLQADRQADGWSRSSPRWPSRNRPGFHARISAGLLGEAGYRNGR